MRPSIRFLALAVVGWAGFRVVSAGQLPGREFFGMGTSEAKTPPVVPTQFAAVEPVEPARPLPQQPQAIAVGAGTPAPAPAPSSTAIPAPQTVVQVQPARPIRYVHAVVGVPVAMKPRTVAVYELPPAQEAADLPLRRAGFTPGQHDYYHPAEYSLLPPLAGTLASLSPLSAPVSHSRDTPANESVPLLEKRQIDRVQLSSWALLRSQQTGIVGSRSLAPGGQLGASQAGARLLYNFNRLLAASARLSSPIGTRGGEAALGVRVHPLVHVPVWLTAERRQAIGRFGGGRSAFALLLEGGVYNQPLPWGFSLDSYLQGGIVSVRQRDLFFDGGLSATRPLWGKLSLGFGVWGGAQPHLARIDVGPRLTVRVRKNLKVHLDWRQKLAGNARPGSGPALTLAGDF